MKTARARLAPVWRRVALVGGVVAVIAVRSPVCANDMAPPRLTLDEALDRMERGAPEAIAARLQVAQAEAVRRTARQVENPTFSTDVGNLPLSRTNPHGLAASETVGTTIRLDQPLPLWGKRGLRIAGAEAGIQSAEAQRRDALRVLRAAVKSAFFGILHDEQLVGLAQANLDRYRESVALSQRRFERGDIAEAEFRKIELEQLKYLTALEEARRTLGESEQLLGRLIGSDTPVAASGALTTPGVSVDAEQGLALATENRPDLAALAAARQQADLQLQLARRERLPDVTVGVDYTNSQFTAGGNIRNTIGAGFSVPLPLLNQKQGEIAQAEVALRQADTDLARARLDVAQDVRDAVRRYQSAQRVERTYARGYLERAKVTLDAAEASYRSGAASLIELLEAQRTYTATQTDYLDALLAAREGLTTLEAAVGKDLTGP